MESVTADFFAHFPASVSRKPRDGDICIVIVIVIVIVIGSERGFCGGFNESILHSVDPALPIIAVGRKLQSRLEGPVTFLESLEGPSAVEEIDPVVTNVIQSMSKYPGSRWVFAYNEDDGNRLEQRIVRPFEWILSSSKPGDPPDGKSVPPTTPPSARSISFASPPLLEGDPDSFQIQLMDQFLFALLYASFYSSFMAENRQRLRHLDSAVSRIENELDKLRLKMNALRQDEITEEIEVILLRVGMDEFA